MIAQSERCEECGGKFQSGARKRIGKRAWCSKTCLIKSGLEPRPERKTFKRDTRPRVPGDGKSHKRDRSEWLGAGM